MKYQDMLEIFETMKQKESMIRLFARLEELGIDVPIGEVDISNLLRNNGYEHIADEVDKFLNSMETETE